MSYMHNESFVRVVGIQSFHTDEQIREMTIKQHAQNNGHYATQICRQCGCIKWDLDGDVKTAIVINGGKDCSCCEPARRLI